MKNEKYIAIIIIAIIIISLIGIIFYPKKTTITLNTLITTEKQAIEFTKQDKEIIEWSIFWKDIKLTYKVYQKENKWAIYVHPKNTADADYLLEFYPNQTITHRQTKWA